jgi:hypothetical protein
VRASGSREAPPPLSGSKAPETIDGLRATGDLRRIAAIFEPGEVRGQAMHRLRGQPEWLSAVAARMSRSGRATAAGQAFLPSA